MRLKGNNDKFLRDMEACQHGAVPGDLADTKENRGCWARPSAVRQRFQPIFQSQRRAV